MWTFASSALEEDFAVAGAETVDVGGVSLTGHSFRRGGAQAMAAAGFEVALIQLFARWESSAVLLYVAEAPLMAALDIAGRMLTAVPGNEGLDMPGIWRNGGLTFADHEERQDRVHRSHR